MLDEYARNLTKMSNEKLIDYIYEKYGICQNSNFSKNSLIVYLKWYEKKFLRKPPIYEYQLESFYPDYKYKIPFFEVFTTKDDLTYC